MNTKTLEPLLAEHPFFADFDPEYLELIAGCASNVKFNAGEKIFQEGDNAEHFYLLRFGKVAIEVFAPGKGTITIQTLHEGDVMGWSWLLPPFRRHHDARALELTRALAFDGTCLRRKCDDDPRLGYQLMRHFTQVIVNRLNGTQLQLIDLYGESNNA